MEFRYKAGRASFKPRFRQGDIEFFFFYTFLFVSHAIWIAAGGYDAATCILVDTNENGFKRV